MKNKTVYTGIKNLSIEGNLVVTAQLSDDDQVHAFIEEGEIKVKQEGSYLYIESLNDSSGSIPIIGNNISIGGNISIGNVSMINGRTFINGQQVTQSSIGEIKPLPRIKLLVPAGVELDLDLDGCGSIDSSAPFFKVYADLSGTSKAEFSAATATITASGTSSAKIELRGGYFQVSSSGCAKVCANGEFSEVQANASGTSYLLTRGNVSGDYIAKVSGCAKINHSGSVGGRVREKVSGCGEVSI